MFVPGRPFQPSLMFLNIIREGWKGLPGTNTPNVLGPFVSYEERSLITLALKVKIKDKIIAETKS
jgi:hypothetical protein